MSSHPFSGVSSRPNSTTALPDLIGLDKRAIDRVEQRFNPGLTSLMGAIGGNAEPPRQQPEGEDIAFLGRLIERQIGDVRTALETPLRALSGKQLLESPAMRRAVTAALRACEHQIAVAGADTIERERNERRYGGQRI